MKQASATGIGKAAALAAAYLHAFVLLASLVLAPVDPQFKTYEDSASIVLTDASLDETVENAKMGGDEKSFWYLAQQARVSLRDAERRCHSQEAPRASGCGRSFHARGPPVISI